MSTKKCGTLSVLVILAVAIAIQWGTCDEKHDKGDKKSLQHGPRQEATEKVTPDKVSRHVIMLYCTFPHQPLIALVHLG